MQDRDATQDPYRDPYPEPHQGPSPEPGVGPGRGPVQDRDDPREAAISRLKAKRAFLSNLASYVIVNAFLVIVWAFSGRGYFWPIWVMAGWGIGLASHAWAVYGRGGITEADVQREMRKGSDRIE